MIETEATKTEVAPDYLASISYLKSLDPDASLSDGTVIIGLNLYLKKKMALKTLRRIALLAVVVCLCTRLFASFDQNTSRP